MKHMIWSNNAEEMNAIFNDLREEEPEMDEALAWATADSISEDELWNAKLDLDKPIGDLIVIADLGLWNGRRKAVKVIENATLASAMSVCEGDFIDWYVEDGEMKIDDVHHDGTNHYLFRAWKNDMIDDFRKGLALHLYGHGFTEKKDLNVDTRPLGADVAKVYGWEVDENE